MSLLNDLEIAYLCEQHGMISPFVPVKTKVDPYGNPCTSYGLSSFGYDMRLGSRWQQYQPSEIPFDLSRPETQQQLHIHELDSFVLMPHEMVLAESLEVFDIPKDIFGITMGKSTWARLGIVCNVTPMEPGWKGVLTIELSNTNVIPVVLKKDWGIAQVSFFQGHPPASAYGRGKYQYQTGVKPATL